MVNLKIGNDTILPSIRKTPFARAAATTSFASRALMVIGFSQRTCFPASIAARHASL